MARVFAKVPFIAADRRRSVRDSRSFPRVRCDARRARDAMLAGAAGAHGLARSSRAEIPPTACGCSSKPNDVGRRFGRLGASRLRSCSRRVNGRSSMPASLFSASAGSTIAGVVLAIRGALAFADGSASNSTNLFMRALERDAPPSMRGEISRRLAVSYVNRGMLTEALETLEAVGIAMLRFRWKTGSKCRRSRSRDLHSRRRRQPSARRSTR